MHYTIAAPAASQHRTEVPIVPPRPFAGVTPGDYTTPIVPLTALVIVETAGGGLAPTVPKILDELGLDLSGRGVCGCGGVLSPPARGVEVRRTLLRDAVCDVATYSPDTTRVRGRRRASTDRGWTHCAPEGPVLVGPRGAPVEMADGPDPRDRAVVARTASASSAARCRLGGRVRARLRSATWGAAVASVPSRRRPRPAGDGVEAGRRQPSTTDPIMHVCAVAYPIGRTLLDSILVAERLALAENTVTGPAWITPRSTYPFVRTNGCSTFRWHPPRRALAGKRAANPSAGTADWRPPSCRRDLSRCGTGLGHTRRSRTSGPTSTAPGLHGRPILGGSRRGTLRDRRTDRRGRSSCG